VVTSCAGAHHPSAGIQPTTQSSAAGGLHPSVDRSCRAAAMIADEPTRSDKGDNLPAWRWRWVAPRSWPQLADGFDPVLADSASVDVGLGDPLF